jgi:llaI.3 like protein
MPKRKSKIVFQIDGQPLLEENRKSFSLSAENRDFNFYRKNQPINNFVGIVIRPDSEVLVSLPKHYYNPKSDSIGEHDAELLFRVLLKQQVKEGYKYSADSDDFEISYPFQAFYNILKYYKQYGLYRESYEITKPGYQGKISWKDTIRKSSNIINRGNLIFVPLHIKKTLDRDVFLSECMSFALTYTIDTFSFLIKEKVSLTRSEKLDFWNNKTYVIRRLRKIQGEMFKDIHKKLIRDLINFYSELDNSGSVFIKHYNFELVWESMVESYLRKHFVGINNSEDGISNVRCSKEGLVFIKNGDKKLKFQKTTEHVDSARKFRLQPDHYATETDSKARSIQYIFDAKYYNEITDLNYKQVSYHAFLRNQADITHSALIAPTEPHGKLMGSRKHLEMNPNYYNNIEEKIIIWEHYLPIKEVMEDYLN